MKSKAREEGREYTLTNLNWLFGFIRLLIQHIGTTIITIIIHNNEHPNIPGTRVWLEASKDTMIVVVVVG